MTKAAMLRILWLRAPRLQCECRRCVTAAPPRRGAPLPAGTHHTRVLCGGHGANLGRHRCGRPGVCVRLRLDSRGSRGSGVADAWCAMRRLIQRRLAAMAAGRPRHHTLPTRLHDAAAARVQCRCLLTCPQCMHVACETGPGCGLRAVNIIQVSVTSSAKSVNVGVDRHDGTAPCRLRRGASTASPDPSWAVDALGVRCLCRRGRCWPTEPGLCRAAVHHHNPPRSDCRT